MISASAYTENLYKMKMDSVNEIWTQTQTIGSLIMLLFILILTIYILRTKHVQCFAITILICMFLKYSIYALSTGLSIYYQTWKEKNKVFVVLFFTLYFSLGSICHLTYAAQYLKTYYLTPGIIQKAHLLLERYRTVIENDFEACTKEFVSKHRWID